MKTKFAGLLLLTLPLWVFGQAGLGTINGTVADRSGAVIAGAHVKVVQLSTKSTREVSSNSQGIFDLPALVPGQYTLTVKAPGFKEETLDNIIINGFQELDLGQISLEVGAGPATSVTVTADQQLIKDSGERVDTLQANQVADIPNNGRNWANLLGMIPGAIANDDTAIAGREYGYYGYQDYTINGKSSEHHADQPGRRKHRRPWQRRKGYRFAKPRIHPGNFGPHE